MAFDSNVSRWRPSAERWAAWASARYHTALDASDVLALISLESDGDPTAVSRTGYRGLGQIGSAALTDFNNGVEPEFSVDWEWLIDGTRADDQIRVIAWHMARGRGIVSGWGMPDAHANAARWADARYSWGGGNLKRSIATFEAMRGGKPTFAELAEFEPDAGVPNVRPWLHADRLVARAESDRGSTPSDRGSTPSIAAWGGASVAIGAVAFAGLAMVAIGIARILSR